jgi:hypothetical protein
MGSRLPCPNRRELIEITHKNEANTIERLIATREDLTLAAVNKAHSLPRDHGFFVNDEILKIALAILYGAHVLRAQLVKDNGVDREI